MLTEKTESALFIGKHVDGQRLVLFERYLFHQVCYPNLVANVANDFGFQWKQNLSTRSGTEVLQHLSGLIFVLNCFETRF